MEKETELTDITFEILGRSEKLRYRISDGMIAGDTFIINGINICEEIVKKMNPSFINEEVILKIKDEIKMHILDIEEKRQYVNKFINYGVSNFLTMLDGYYDKNEKKRIKQL